WSRKEARLVSLLASIQHVLQWLLNHLFLKTNVKGGSPGMPHPPPLLLGRTMSLDPSGVGMVSSWLCICPTLSRKEARLVSLLASNQHVLQWLLNHLFLKTNVKGGSPGMP